MAQRRWRPTRQTSGEQPRTAAQLAGEIARGGYVLSDCDGQPGEMIPISVAAEIELVVSAAKALNGRRARKVRVVFLPCVPSVSIIRMRRTKSRWYCQMLYANVWRFSQHRRILGTLRGLNGFAIGMTSFGEPVQGNVLFKHLVFTPEYPLAQARSY